MSLTFTVLAAISLAFTVISLFILLTIINNFKGVLRNVMNFLLLIIMLLIVRGGLRFTNVFSVNMLDSVNLVMNFIITFFILCAMLNLKKMVKIVRKKK